MGLFLITDTQNKKQNKHKNKKTKQQKENKYIYKCSHQSKLSMPIPIAQARRMVFIDLFVCLFFFTP
jgi:hypothetical protein